MATFGPKQRDVASEYNEVYENTAARFGVMNAKADRGSQTLTSRPSEDGRVAKQKVRYRGPAEVIDFNEEKTRREQTVNRRYQEEINYLQATAANTNTPTKAKIKISLVDRALGNVFAYICWSISLYISVFQIFFLTLSFMLLGWTSMTETSWLAWAANETAQVGAAMFGWEYTDLMPMAMICGFLGIACGLISLFGFALFAMFLRLHPLNGNGGGLKTGLFILAIVTSIVPLNTALWIWAVKHYPK
ncbi:MAG: hypothetical protein V4668_03855 [Patescibacteria group bacterium]